MPEWFGTDGLRGESYTYPLTPQVFFNLGFYFGQYILQSDSNVCLTARDTRKSGEDLQKAFNEGLCKAGIRVLDTGILPTPTAIYLAVKNRIHAGVITASHNLYPDNGLKLVNPDGSKISSDVEEWLEQMMDQSPSGGGTTGGKIEDAHQSAVEDYLSLVKSTFTHLEESPIHVVLDVARGATFELIPAVFKHLRIPSTVLYNDPDGVNINRECGAVHPEVLASHVKELASSPTDDIIGFSFDGDGDRMIAYHPRAGILDGHYLLGTVAIASHDHGSRPAVVSTVMANQGLEVFLQRYQIELLRTPVGDKYVAEALVENDLYYGAEPSGHFINRHLSPTGDGCLSALLFLDLYLNESDAFETFIKEYRPFPQILKNVRVPVKIPLERLKTLNHRLALHQARMGPAGRIYIRYSGTEPVLRILVEADTPALAGRVAEDLADAVAKDFHALQGQFAS